VRAIKPTDIGDATRQPNHDKSLVNTADCTRGGIPAVGTGVGIGVGTHLQGCSVWKNVRAVSYKATTKINGNEFRTLPHNYRTESGGIGKAKVRFPKIIRFRRTEATISGKTPNYPFYRLACYVAGKRVPAVSNPMASQARSRTESPRDCGGLPGRRAHRRAVPRSPRGFSRTAKWTARFIRLASMSSNAGMSVQVYGCNHVAIEVDDVEKAVAFY